MIFLQQHPDIEDTMAKNRTHNLLVESLLDILYGTSHHHQERAVDTLQRYFLFEYF